MINPCFSPFPYLTTQTFSLRNLLPSDENEIFRLRSSDEINKYLDRPKANSIEDAREFIRKITKGVENNDSIFWVVTPKNETRFLGTICIWQISREAAKAEIGYELLPENHGKGIMQEVIPEIIRYGFEQMNLQTIEAEMSLRNVKSVRLLEKNDFTLAAINPENSDLAIYALNKQH